eukprot:CAMPEP_0204079816 /NCGR_PEP_ID=MMETSP0360-20130528/172962_1 /ASSEMBLY_ACC=CAM_ASM_000342 /TAXON_ID=268821 /ORGANISM="Scrippsiella Hangoei, Strain SHTV-5" /LENGTH=171 /DNA_ID=CAMNT_0051028565 /DNA_START=83 /DNA_END=598 /DNA_ORIENTATION=-
MKRTCQDTVKTLEKAPTAPRRVPRVRTGPQAAIQSGTHVENTSSRRGIFVLSDAGPLENRPSTVHDHPAISGNIELDELADLSPPLRRLLLRAAEHVFCEGVLKQPRDGAAQRSGPVGGVEALLQNPLLKAVCEGDVQLPFSQSGDNLLEFNLGDGTDVLSGQRPENDYLV